MGWSKSLAAGIHRRVPFFDRDDMIQAAHMGLWKAAVKFDTNKNDSFRGFAFEYVRGEIWMSVRRAAFRNAKHQSMEVRSDHQPRIDADRVFYAPLMDAISVRRTHGFEELTGGPEQNIEAAVQLRQINKFLRAAIKTLTAAERYVLEEHVIEGRVMRDVAAEIGRKVVTGFTYKRAALAKLREFLRARGIEGVEL